jgi:hypothetical protein
MLNRQSDQNSIPETRTIARTCFTSCLMAIERPEKASE